MKSNVFVRKIKYLSALVVTVAMLFLCGCGSTGSSSSQGQPVDPGQSEVRTEASEATETTESTEATENTVNAETILASVMCAAPVEELYQTYLTGYDTVVDIYGELGLEEDIISEDFDLAAVRVYAAKSDFYVIIKTDMVDAVKDILEDYRQARIGDFTGYAPAEEKKLRDSVVISEGNYVALLVNERNDAAEDAFFAALKGDISEEASEMITELHKNLTPVNSFVDGSGSARLEDGTVLIEEVEGVIEPYDTAPIVEAYRTGDDSSLNDRDKTVLAKAKDIIAGHIYEGMSVLDKEKAIHDYLVANAQYDENCLIYSKWYTEFSDQPYGCLINGQAICLGYTTTFKMFMDMLDIECIIVKGRANEDEANHAWNMVRLDDDCWYIVDVTWDDPVGGIGIYYTYFNVTDEWLEATWHFWDEENYPRAQGGVYEFTFWD